MAGTYHSLARLGDRTLRAWGWNGDGQLGDGTTTECLTPVRVGTLSGITAVAAGTWNGHAAATTGEETTSYGYDRLWRLTSASASEGSAISRDDRAGNRLSRTRGGRTTTWGDDQADRFLLAPDHQVDPTGNVTSIPGFVQRYDAANRLVEAMGGGSVLNSRYDGDGLRTWQGKGVVGGGAVYEVTAL